MGTKDTVVASPLSQAMAMAVKLHMVRRNLQGHFRFICLTDNTEGIRSEVECFPIPALDLPAGIPERGWNKLTTFSTDPEKQFETVLAVKDEVFPHAPYPNWTALGVNWLAGFDFEIKVIAKLP